MKCYLKVNIDAEAKIIDVFRFTGSAIEKRITRMERTNRVLVWTGSVNLANSSVEIIIAQRLLPFAMEWTIAAMDQRRRIVTFRVPRTNSNAIRRVVVFLERGSAMETTTAVTVRMKIRLFAIRGRTILTRNSPARTEGVSRNRGTATRITIAVADRMSRPTFAGRETAQPDEDAALNGAITVVFRNGSSATAKMIAVMVNIVPYSGIRNFNF